MAIFSKDNIQAVLKSIAIGVAQNPDARPVLRINSRVPAADINAGVDILKAVPNFRFQLTDAMFIANGGAASGATDVRITGTDANGNTVVLVTCLIAGLTQSTMLRAGEANCTVLADGASFFDLKSGTPIRISKTGGTLAGATSIEVILDYNLVKGY